MSNLRASSVSPRLRGEIGTTQVETPIVVVKVGGSLLSLPDLSGRLQTIRSELRPMRPLIVCGGGDAADVVRRWQTVHDMTDEQAHWLALRAVSMNECLLSQLLPDAAMAQCRDEIHAAWNAGRLPILAAESFIRRAEPTASLPLPHDWSVTSDSIAAWTARELGGDRLVLLKSCELPKHITLTSAATQGLVDASFPRTAAGLAVAWVNLRADVPRMVEWQRAPASQPS